MWKKGSVFLKKRGSREVEHFHKRKWDTEAEDPLSKGRCWRFQTNVAVSFLHLSWCEEFVPVLCDGCLQPLVCCSPINIPQCFSFQSVQWKSVSAFLPSVIGVGIALCAAIAEHFWLSCRIVSLASCRARFRLCPKLQNQRLLGDCAASCPPVCPIMFRTSKTVTLMERPGSKCPLGFCWWSGSFMRKKLMGIRD